MRIAILDTDAPHAEFIAHALERGAHRCHRFVSRRAFLLRVQRDTFDLAVLVDKPGAWCCESALRQLRARTPIWPVLVMTPRTDEASVAAILDAGASDCMHDAPRGVELLARVDALLRLARLCAPVGATMLHCGHYVFDTARGTVHACGRPIALTRKEFDLALLLFRNPSRDLSRAYIVESVWAREQHVTSRTVDTHASRLRSKLGLVPGGGYVLMSIYSHGYRLERLAAQVEPAAAA